VVLCALVKNPAASCACAQAQLAREPVRYPGSFHVKGIGCIEAGFRQKRTVAV